MKSFFTIQRQWWRITLFLLWIGAFLFLLVTRKYIVFLRPEFAILLGLGILTLMGFLFSGGLERSPRPASGLEIVRGCILILPLVYMLNASAKLDSSDFRNRFLGPSPAMDSSICSLKPKGERVNNSGLNTATSPSDPSGEIIEEVTILDLKTAPQQYSGRQVLVVGMVFQSEEFDKIFGDNSHVLFRFTVNCCAADSAPVYALIKGDELPILPDDTWVKVGGVFEMEQTGNYSIPVIKDAVVEATDEPKIPYLY
ncbi:MAG: TIGR03943 family protein [Desulfobulbaceae bacterium]|nr:TIGR03943 family protein [Desulfobulbaceae bacterium]